MPEVTLTKKDEDMDLDTFVNQQFVDYFKVTNKILETELKDPRSKLQFQDYERLMSLHEQRLLRMVKELKDINEARKKPQVFKQKINEIWQKLSPQKSRPKHLTDDNVLKLWVKDSINKYVSEFQKTLELTKRRVRQHTNFIGAIPQEIKGMVIQEFNDKKRKVLTKLADVLKKQTNKLEKNLDKIPQKEVHKAKHEPKPMGKSPLDEPKPFPFRKNKGLQI